MEQHDVTQIRSVDHRESNSSPGVARGAPLAVGSRIGNFQVERILGIGGFGIVYLAVQDVTGRYVAIKEYFPSAMLERVGAYDVRLKSAEDQELFMMGMRSFVKEATLLSSLNHEGLVQVLHFWEEHGTAYMVMPYYEGQPLSRYLGQKDCTITTDFILNILAKLLPTLAYLHDRNIFHRDISPDNIFLLTNGDPVLLDFGAARHIVDKAENVTVILKSGYAPIEQYDEHGEQGAWTDIYALSALLYKLITGQPPQASAARMYHDTVTPLAADYAERYPLGLLQAIDAGLAVKPEQRPATIDIWKGILQSDGSQAWRADESVITFRPKAKPSKYRRIWQTGLALALALAAYAVMQPGSYQTLMGVEIRKSYATLEKQLAEQQRVTGDAAQKVATLQAQLAAARPEAAAPVQQALLMAEEARFGAEQTYQVMQDKYGRELASIKQKMAQATAAQQQGNNDEARYWFDAAQQQIDAVNLWRTTLARELKAKRNILIKELAGAWAVKSCKSSRSVWTVDGKVLQVARPNEDTLLQNIIAAYDNRVYTNILSTDDHGAAFVEYRYNDGKVEVTRGDQTEVYVLCGS